MRSRSRRGERSIGRRLQEDRFVDERRRVGTRGGLRSSIGRLHVGPRGRSVRVATPVMRRTDPYRVTLPVGRSAIRGGCDRDDRGPRNRREVDRVGYGGNHVHHARRVDRRPQDLGVGVRGACDRHQRTMGSRIKRFAPRSSVDAIAMSTLRAPHAKTHRSRSQLDWIASVRSRSMKAKRARDEGNHLSSRDPCLRPQSGRVELLDIVPSHRRATCSGS